MTTTAVEASSTQTAAGASPAANAPANAGASTEAPDLIRLNLAGATGTATPESSNTPAEPVEGDGRAGGPDAGKADLAGERKARQAAEAEATTAKTQLAAVLKALGVETGAPAEDPQVTAQRAQAETLEARREVAVVRHAPRDQHGNPTVNVNALLDSRAFMASLSTVDPNDAGAIRAAIEAHVQANPGTAGVRYAAPGGDITATGDPGSGAATMDDLIRGRAR